MVRRTDHGFLCLDGFVLNVLRGQPLYFTVSTSQVRPVEVGPFCNP
jgi:hypothetical protein